MELEVNKIYHHFKGKDYKILMFGIDSETLEEVVVYQSTMDDKIWVRQKTMFASLVDKKKYPNIKQKYRFEPL